MWSRLGTAVAALAAGVGLFAQPAGPARAEQAVDLELVLAVDVSLSMDLDEQRIQRDGYIAALRDPLVWKAIATGPTGRIAVTYLEWAGIATQQTVVPWSLIDGPDAARGFADRLEQAPISRARMTSISGALEYGARTLEANPFKGRRRVIDVSGDGPNNQGPLIEPTRDRLVAQGIVINGLPIMIKFGGPYGNFDIANLDQYYADCVIGGPGSFSLPVREKSALPEAIRRKLILEISGLPPPASEARIIPVQAVPPAATPDKTDCLVGERLWNEFMRGR